MGRLNGQIFCGECGWTWKEKFFVFAASRVCRDRKKLSWQHAQTCAGERSDVMVENLKCLCEE
jgi:hypothetical protein